MSLLKRYLHEPIVHFIVAGFLLYGLAVMVRGDDLNPRSNSVIEVDREALLEFIQFRNNVFEPQAFDGYLDNLDARERQQLIDDYVAEELMYREAATLGLDRSDYIIRQRMVEKMRFLLNDLAGSDERPGEQELQNYLTDKLSDYRIPPSVTFTHVYFDSSRHGPEEARNRAEEALKRLNEEQSGFNDAGGVGDRFPFLRNYVERTVEYVGGHFGKAFADELMAMDAHGSRWQGPVPSAYGYHLVLLTELSRGRKATLEEVRHELEQDFIQERSREGLQEMIGNLREEYDVQINL